MLRNLTRMARIDPSACSSSAVAPSLQDLAALEHLSVLTPPVECHPRSDAARHHSIVRLPYDLYSLHGTPRGRADRQLPRSLHPKRSWREDRQALRRPSQAPPAGPHVSSACSCQNFPPFLQASSMESAASRLA